MINRIAGPLIKPSWPFELNKDSPQARGLVGWWPGEPSGGKTLYEMSQGLNTSNLLNGSIQGNALNWGADVDSGRALVFNGANTIVNAGTPINGVSPFTLSIWVYVTAPNVFKVLINCGNNSNTGVNIQTSNIAGKFTFTTPGLTAISATTTVNMWHLLTGTLSAGSNNMVFYFDGIKVSSGTSTLPTLSAFTFGSLVGSAQFAGLMSDFRIYNRALSPAEVFALYDPATRWDLRYVPGRKIYSFGSVPIPPTVGGSNLLGEGTLLGANLLGNGTLVIG